MEAFFTYITANWPTIVAGILAFLASVDKIGLMFFKTGENLFKYYRESFPKKEEPLVNSDQREDVIYSVAMEHEKEKPIATFDPKIIISSENTEEEKNETTKIPE